MSKENQQGRRYGILRVSSQLLIEALGLPPDTRIDAVQIALDEPEVFHLKVEQSELPLLAPGALIPRLTAELRKDVVEGQAYETRFVRWVL